MRIAVIGAGISGLGCAHALGREHQVTLYEAAPRLGGHTNTIDVTLDGVTAAVDTGFIVYNERTYPRLIALFAELGVPTAKSEMSFGVSVERAGRRLEWSGSNLDSVFAQRRNLASPAFLGMVRDILRFNRDATALAADAALGAGEQRSLGDWLDARGYGRAFREWYLLPMAAAIWSCPIATMLRYPAATFIRFCHNHGLLQVENRPQWYTVRGGARQYVRRIAARLADVRVGEPVHEVRREADGRVLVRSASGPAHYDEVVLATHSDQALRLLADADGLERELLASVGYQPNRAVVHTDQALLPENRKVWSSWNYLSSGGEEPQVSVSYLMNRLQPLPFERPVVVSLNPLAEPRPDTVIAEFDYEHPVFDAAAVHAQARLPDVQGRNGVWFAGAWTGYGFHEDGLKSGLVVAESLRARGLRPRRIAA
jgi:predicted NAD/FAD-binding protein